MSQTVRSFLVLLVGGAAVAFAADGLVRSAAFRLPKDFPEYWAAGRLNLRGENPYDPAKLLAEQRLASVAGRRQPLESVAGLDLLTALHVPTVVSL